MHDEYPFRAASVFQTRRKIRGDGSAAQEAMDEINAVVRERGSWDGSLFDWVGVVINVVATPEEVPSEPLVRRISKGELPVVVDVDVESLSGLEHADLVVAFKRLMLRGLVAGLRAKGQDASFAAAALSVL